MEIMKEARSAYKRIFGDNGDKTQEAATRTVRLEMLNDWQNVFSGRSDYSNDIVVQACVSTIARHIGKLRANPVEIQNGHKGPSSNVSLVHMLQVSPNPYMTAYNLQYRLAINALLTGNAYAAITKDENGNPLEIWPIDYNTAEAREVDGEPYILFRFSSGKSRCLPYANLIHIKHNFSEGELIAHSRDNLNENLSLLNTLQQSFANSAVNSGRVRGVAQISGQIGQDAWQSKAAALNKQLQSQESGGIVATDATVKFTPFSGNPVPADHTQLDYVRDNIYRYYGISEAIVSGQYTEDQWTAFFESTLEPLAIEMSQEYTRKLFSMKEQLAGKAVVFDANRLAYANTATKTELIRQLRPLGILTTNQALEIMDLPPVADGDDRVQTLNVANTDIVDGYQQKKKSRGGEKHG